MSKSTDTKSDEFAKAAVVLVALPILHLLSAAALLWGYAFEFGHGLMTFVSANDLIRMSLRYLMIVDLALILIPSVFVFMFYMDGEDHETVRMLGFFGNLFILSTIIIMAGGIYVFAGRISLGTISLTVPCLIFLFLFYLRKYAQLRHWRYFVFQWMLTLCSLFIVIGMSIGDSEGKITYQNAPSQLAQCGNKYVLRQFSDYYLAIRPDARYVLIDSDCKEKFLLSP